MILQAASSAPQGRFVITENAISSSLTSMTPASIDSGKFAKDGLSALENAYDQASDKASDKNYNRLCHIFVYTIIYANRIFSSLPKSDKWSDDWETKWKGTVLNYNHFVRDYSLGEALLINDQECRELDPAFNELFSLFSKTEKGFYPRLNDYISALHNKFFPKEPVMQTTGSYMIEECDALTALLSNI